MFVSETYNLCRFTCTFFFFQILHELGSVWSVVEPNVFVCVQHTVPLTQLSMWGLVVLVAQSCPTLCNPMNCSPPGSSVHGDSPGKNAGVGCQALLQGNLPDPGVEPRSLVLQADSLPSETPGKPMWGLFT